MKTQLCLSICISLVCSAADDTKLRLLAGPENDRGLTMVMRSLHNYETSRVPESSLLIVGEERSGRRSLALEIAKQAERSYERFPFEADFSSIGSFSCFAQRQLAIADEKPHVAILTGMQTLDKNIHDLADTLKLMREKRGLFLVGVHNVACEGEDIGGYFKRRMRISRPNVSLRKDILEYYLTQEWATQELVSLIAENSEGISSGQLKDFSDSLYELYEEFGDVDADCVLQELKHHIPDTVALHAMREDRETRISIERQIRVRYVVAGIGAALAVAQLGALVLTRNSSHADTINRGFFITRDIADRICNIVFLSLSSNN